MSKQTPQRAGTSTEVLAAAHAAIQSVRAEHFQYRPAGFDDYDCCAGCNKVAFPTYVAWPCPTARIIAAYDTAVRDAHTRALDSSPAVVTDTERE